MRHKKRYINLQGSFFFLCLQKKKMKVIQLWHDDTLEEFQPYVAFQSQHPYDNAVSVSMIQYCANTCSMTAIPRLHKHRSTNPTAPHTDEAIVSPL